MTRKRREMQTNKRTIHVAKNQWHLAWDNAIAPIASVASGAVIEFDLLDASAGRSGRTPPSRPSARWISRAWTKSTGRSTSRGCAGGHLADRVPGVAAGGLGLDGIIPGFGLLADEFSEPALTAWRLQGDADGAWAEFVPGIRIPLDPFCGEIGLRRRRRVPTRRSHHIGTVATWIPGT